MIANKYLSIIWQWQILEERDEEEALVSVFLLVVRPKDRPVTPLTARVTILTSNFYRI